MKIVNGNFHMDVADVRWCNGMKIVIEPVGKTDVVVTVYQGEQANAISREFYGPAGTTHMGGDGPLNDSSNFNQ